MQKLSKPLTSLTSRTARSSAVVRALSSKEIRDYPKPLATKRHGLDILHDPLWNKSLAFDISERDRLGLRGLLPPTVRSQESQVQRTIGHIRRLPDDVSKNLYLQDLHNRNETLFHRILIEFVSAPQEILLQF